MGLELIDTTLRDGAQSPLMFDSKKYLFSLDDKIKIVEGLIKLGVRYFEFFSPIVSKKEETDFIEIKKYIQEKKYKNIKFLAHVRCHKDDIETAIKAGFDGLNMYIGTSKESQKFNHGKNLNEIVALAVTTLKEVRKKNPNLYIRFSGEDAFRTNLKDLFFVYDAIHLYVKTLGMPDTVGIANPKEVELRVRTLKNRYKNKELECHFHNDRGLSVINTLTAIENGVKFIDTSIWGLAERSGITSTTSILLNLYEENKKLVKNYHLENCYPLNVLMGSILKLQVPYTECVSLTNRTHTAGVHSGAVLKNKKVYEAHNLSNFGVNKNSVLLGPLSGWNLVFYYLKEVLNYNLDEEMAKKITYEFKNNIFKISKKNSPEKLLIKICDDKKLEKVILSKSIQEKRFENLS